MELNGFEIGDLRSDGFPDPVIHLDDELLSFLADDLVAMIQQSLHVFDHRLNRNHLERRREVVKRAVEERGSERRRKRGGRGVEEGVEEGEEEAREKGDKTRGKKKELENSGYWRYSGYWSNNNNNHKDSSS